MIENGNVENRLRLVPSETNPALFPSHVTLCDVTGFRVAHTSLPQKLHEVGALVCGSVVGLGTDVLDYRLELLQRRDVSNGFLRFLPLGFYSFERRSANHLVCQGNLEELLEESTVAIVAGVLEASLVPCQPFV